MNDPEAPQLSGCAENHLGLSIPLWQALVGRRNRFHMGKTCCSSQGRKQSHHDTQVGVEQGADSLAELGVGWAQSPVQGRGKWVFRRL
jgi:hypothetical protein